MERFLVVIGKNVLFNERTNPSSWKAKNNHQTKLGWVGRKMRAKTMGQALKYSGIWGGLGPNKTVADWEQFEGKS